MKEVIIETTAMMAFNAAVVSALDADRGLSGFVLAHGQAGRGKTVACDQYYSLNGGARVKVWQNWSQTDFMQRVLFEVRGQNGDMPRHRGNRCKEMIVEQLRNRRMPIIIDEADRLRMERIEDLRDIFEETGVPVVLVGEEGLLGLLTERRRIWSRVVHEVEFGPISGEEVAVYALDAAGLDIPDDLCGRIAAKAEGDFRLVRNMLLLLEQSARAQERGDVGEGMLDTVLKAKSWRRK